MTASSRGWSGDSTVISVIAWKLSVRTVVASAWPALSDWRMKWA